MYFDAENCWTPNRIAFFRRRDQATRAWQVRCRQTVLFDSGVEKIRLLPSGDRRHSIAHDECEFGRGLLFEDGSIHTWPEDDENHYDYEHRLFALDGQEWCFESKGWPFYINPSGVNAYCLPNRMVRPVQEFFGVGEADPDYEERERCY